MKNDNLKGQHRINEQIRAKEVRIVGDDIESAVYPLAQALRMAEEHEADLVEISPNAVPPVCRIIDYSKFLYQLKTTSHIPKTVLPYLSALLHHS